MTTANAHPHTDTHERIAIVLNGIIENHAALREELAASGARFTSETDAEVVAHLIAEHFDGDLVQAVRTALPRLAGHYAIAAICRDAPGVLVGARHECPLIAGLADGEGFLASSIAALLPETRRVRVLKDGEIAVVTGFGAEFVALDGAPVAGHVDEANWDDDVPERGSFETFMLKEIHEQGAAVARTLGGAAAPALLPEDTLRAIQRVTLVGCGTSYHAGLAARMALERWACVPVDVELASEFRYRDPIVGRDALVIGITQSGETADTLAAMRLAREERAPVMAVTNVIGSQATRDADGTILTAAGTEIGVAATKSFVAQVSALYAFALRLGRLRGVLTAAQARRLAAELEALPEMLDLLVPVAEQHMRGLSETLAEAPFFLFLGRLSGLPVALEGALKLKEVSYIPTDAYAAGEMKHGPIALISEGTPVVCVATDPAVVDKTLSNIAEVKARGAKVIAIATAGHKEVAEQADEIFYVPEADPAIQIPLAVVPLQLLAYYVARHRGLNVDQPRNLAKTVTVE